MSSSEDKLRKSIVCIVCGKEIGTGFFIFPDGRVLTCHHVIRESKSGKEIWIKFEGRDYPAEIVVVSESSDIAVIMPKLPDDKTLPDLPDLGVWNDGTTEENKCRSFGFRSPGMEGWHCETDILGRISDAGMMRLQLASEANGAEGIRPGMSGAPLYDENSGKIVGMIALREKEPGETIPLTIPIEEIARVYPRLKARLRWEPPPEEDMKFVNRKTELDEVCDPNAPPYIFFEAPSGYGKTKLLKRIEYDESKHKWLCVYADISEIADTPFDLVGLAHKIAGQAGSADLTNLDNPKDIGLMLGGQLRERITARNALGFVLLLDSVERLPENETDAFLNEFLVSLNKAFPKPEKCKFRIRIAGRNGGTSWQEKAKKAFLIDKKEFHIEVKPLTPFLFEFVRETVEKTLPFLAETEVGLCAAHLMEMTGGHPGCMAEIIRHIEKERNSLSHIEEHFEKNEDRYYDEIVLPVARSVASSIPEHLADVFEVLSIFRIYNLKMLEQIIKSCLTEKNETPKPEYLRKELPKTYLVSRSKKVSGFLEDGIVRRLLAIRLRRESYERFMELCEKAKAIYEQYIENEDRDAEYIAFEGIFQELRLRYYREKHDSERGNVLRNIFFEDNGILCKYSKILVSKENADEMKETFPNLLNDRNENWEFRFALNFFLRKDQYSDEPCEEMAKCVKRFFEQNGGKND